MQDTKPLSGLNAAELAEHLRRHFAAVGGLACATEAELAGELVRRARRVGELEGRVRELTYQLWKRGLGCGCPGWCLTAARRRVCWGGYGWFAVALRLACAG